jgi:nitrite reductase/ring-hydroxylating ferredoxin subunit
MSFESPEIELCKIQDVDKSSHKDRLIMYCLMSYFVLIPFMVTIITSEDTYSINCDKSFQKYDTSTGECIHKLKSFQENKCITYAENTGECVEWNVYRDTSLVYFRYFVFICSSIYLIRIPYEVYIYCVYIKNKEEINKVSKIL